MRPTLRSRLVFALWVAAAAAAGGALRAHSMAPTAAASPEAHRARVPAHTMTGETAPGRLDPTYAGVVARPRSPAPPQLPPWQAPEPPPDPARVRARLADLSPLLPPVEGPRLRRRCPVPRAASVHVRDLATNRVLVAARDRMPANPASNLKVVTATAAVELLGADYRFHTELYVDGADLILRGTGDPSLLPRDLYALLDAAEALVDLRAVRRVVADATAFSGDPPPGFVPSTAPDAYRAPPSALSLQFNTVELVDGPGGYTVRPPSTGVRLLDRRRRRPAPARVLVQPDASGTRIVLTGGTGLLEAPRARVLDPPRFVAGVLAAMIATRTGRPAPAVVTGRVPAHAPLLHVHRSRPLVDLAAASLKYSNNFTAEQLLRALGRAATGRPGTTEAGVAAVRAWWRAIGGRDEALVLVNGSGLSHRTRISARALAAVLARVADPASPSHGLLPSLAVAGQDGTLRGRMREIAGRVRGKTGTLDGVSALSGIAAAGGRTVAFAVLQNGVRDLAAARAAQDAFVRCLLAALDAPLDRP